MKGSQPHDAGKTFSAEAMNFFRRANPGERFRVTTTDSAASQMGRPYAHAREVEAAIVTDLELEPGADCVLVLTDGGGMLRVLIEAGESEIVVAARNQRKHPGAVAVPRSDIVAIGRVVGILVDPPAGKRRIPEVQS